MNLLLIKTSSIGDVVHTFPAVTDAAEARPGLSVDWVVEDAFADIVTWHPAVRRALPVAWRVWRKRPIAGLAGGHLKRFRQRLRADEHALTLDAQGLVKSAAMARLAKGPRHGFDRRSAREPLASLAYDRRHRVGQGAHAVDRLRLLFALTLGYAVPDGPPRFALTRPPAAPAPVEGAYLVGLHGTQWVSKQWPVAHWQALADWADARGLALVLFASGAPEEAARTAAIAENRPGVTVLPRPTMATIGSVLAGAKATVAVDTGFAHLSAALATPTVTLYGPTTPTLTGTRGHAAVNLVAPGREAASTAIRTEKDKPSAWMAALTVERVTAALADLGVGVAG